MKGVKGLTLIEVLVAAVILFAALSLSAVSISTLRQSSAQAEKVIKTLQPARMIMLSIREHIRADPQDSLSGRGGVEQVSYQWHAQLLKAGSAPEQLDIDSGSIVTPPQRFRLYSVDLTLQFAGRTEQLQFKELAWQPLTY